MDNRFETIVDKHDGRVDLRAAITLPDGFMVEIAVEDIDGEPGISAYAGVPYPLEDCPPDLIYHASVEELR